MKQLIIYSGKKTRRLIYVLDEVFVRRLGLTYLLTDDTNAFLESSETCKLNYSKEKFEGIPQLFPADILFEKRIQAQELSKSGSGDNFKIFTSKNSELGFDPLAAAFYFLSLYEQYLPHREDDHGRFLSRESLLVQNQSHQIPLVEVYTQLLFTWISSYYADLDRSHSTFLHNVTVDVDQTFALRAKGLAGTMAGVAGDVLKGRNIGLRLGVMLGNQSDPIDIYQELIALCRRRNIKPKFFFQVGENSRFDQNNPAHLNAVRQKINEISLSSEIGLHPSYYSSSNDLIDQEHHRLTKLTAREVISNRQHYLRYKLPYTFRTLVRLGMQQDYSIGFHDLNGFRAATCLPFRFYDLEAEETLDLELRPMSFMDLILIRNHENLDDAYAEMNSIIDVVKKYRGEVVSTWHPDVLAGYNHHLSAIELLKRMLEDD